MAAPELAQTAGAVGSRACCVSNPGRIVQLDVIKWSALISDW
jgi:hypothetical protein